MSAARRSRKHKRRDAKDRVIAENGRLIAELRRENAALREQVAALLKRVSDLEARLGQNSSNTGLPPSSDPPWNPAPKKRRKGAGRKPGGQPGHPGTSRKLFPPEEVDQTVVVFPDQCKGCGSKLQPLAGGKGIKAPVRHQVCEIPRTVAYVIEYLLHTLACPGCGKATRAQLPEGVPAGCAGPRLQAVATILRGRFRLSCREAVEALVTFFGEKAEISLGTLVDLEGQTSGALARPHEEALQAVREAEVVHADETGWKLAGKKAWLWVAATPFLAAFRIDPKRSGEAFKRLLGAFGGILTSDRWPAYSSHPVSLRQICWAHLKRDFQKIVDRDGAGAAIGEWGLREIARIFALWRDFRAGLLDRRDLRRALVPIRARVGRLLRRGANSEEKKTARFCRRVLKLWPALWTFARVEGVDPTNNHAERCLRPAVLWRKGSFGTQSESGNRFVERLLTTAQSLRLQGRLVLDFVETAIRAKMVGGPAPSLLPGSETDRHCESSEACQPTASPLSFAA